MNTSVCRKHQEIGEREVLISLLLEAAGIYVHLISSNSKILHTFTGNGKAVMVTKTNIFIFENKSFSNKRFIFFSFFFLSFFFFFWLFQGIWKFPGQRLNWNLSGSLWLVLQQRQVLNPCTWPGTGQSCHRDKPILLCHSGNSQRRIIFETEKAFQRSSIVFPKVCAKKY